MHQTKNFHENSLRTPYPGLLFTLGGPDLSTRFPLVNSQLIAFLPCRLSKAVSIYLSTLINIVYLRLRYLGHEILQRLVHLDNVLPLGAFPTARDAIEHPFRLHDVGFCRTQTLNMFLRLRTAQALRCDDVCAPGRREPVGVSTLSTP